MPSEKSERSLLAPFQETGEEHLLDLALRVRIFKNAFEAWEELHQVPVDGTVQLRSVIRCLRSMQDPSLNHGGSIKSYDSFRLYLRQFGERLFPGITPYFGDLMSMHASIYSGGRGIVLTMGDSHIQYVLTQIQSFREMGCTLPVEVMYLGEDGLDEQLRERLEALPGVVTRNMGVMINDASWQLKGVCSSAYG